MTKALYFTANKLVKNKDIEQAKARITEKLSMLRGHSLNVEIAESSDGIFIAEVKSDEPFNAFAIERILFPPKRRRFR